MKVNFFLSGVLVLLTLYSCQSDNRENTEKNDNEEVNTKQETPVKMIELLVGEWQREGSGVQQDNAGERITFTEEARYVRRAGNQKLDSGAFRMNEQLRNLYLESEANGQPSEFEITLEGDVLTLKPKKANEGELGDTAGYTYRRIGEGSISEEKRGEDQ